jgi:hypothetical protein
MATDADPRFKAFPTYPLIMGFKGTEFEVVNFYEKANAKFPPGLPKMGILHCLSNLTIDWSRGVDGERYIEIIKPIPTTSKGRRFELRRETIGAYDKGKAGLVLEEQTLLVDADSGEVYTKIIGSAFFVGQVYPFTSPADVRADMVARKAQRSLLIKRLQGRHQTVLQISKPVLDRLFFIA